jgi:hypothetical protein
LKSPCSEAEWSEPTLEPDEADYSDSKSESVGAITTVL